MDRFRLSTKTTSTGEYERNNYWLRALDVNISGDDARLDHAFGIFSASIDDWIRRVREEWVRMRPDAKPDGMFDYSFSDDELQTLVDGISPLAEHAEVHDLIVKPRPLAQD